MSVAHSGLYPTRPMTRPESEEERTDLLMTCELYADVLEAIALATEDSHVRSLALRALGLDSRYEGPLRTVARMGLIDGTGSIAGSDSIAATQALSRRGARQTGPVLWIRRKDVESD